MTGVTRIAVIVAAGMLVVQPAVASDLRESQAAQRQSSAFAGLSLRLPLGPAQKAKPTARLQLTTSHTFRNERTGAIQTFRAQGLEIGAAKGGKPALYLNGQNAADMEKRLNLNPRGGTAEGTILTVALVAVGVLVLVNLDGL